MKNRMYEKIKFFKDNFSEYLHDMKISEHGLTESETNPYHSEGDVWTHTMCVCSQVQHSLDVVQWACLLHDIGKPDCRGVETKDDFTKVNFRNHGAYGIYKALEVLNKATEFKQFNISEEDKILVLKLVAKHQDLYNGMKNYQAPQEDIFYKELYQVCNADSTGGISQNFDRTKLDSPTKVTPVINKEYPNLVLLIGVQNSGKSTYCDNKYSGYTKISRDGILVDFVHQHSGYNMTYTGCWNYCNERDLHKEVDKLLYMKFNQATRNKENIVIDMTNMSKKSRRKWLQVKNYNKKAVLFITEYDELFKRNANRFGKCLATGVIKNTMKRLVWPDYKEFCVIDVKL